MSHLGNILTLIRMGYLPPDIDLKDLKKTLYYKLWEYFRVVCIFAEYVPPNVEDIKCKKLGGKCNFDDCPVVKRAIKMYEQSLKFD